jgi:hypothetical protein
MSMRAPLIWELTADVPGVGTTVVQSGIILGEVPESATLTEVAIIPWAAVTASTNGFRTVNVFNRGTTGTGTVLAASLDTSVTGFTDNDERLATLATAANLILNAGDVLEVTETVQSSGVAHGGYHIVAKVSRT